MRHSTALRQRGGSRNGGPATRVRKGCERSSNGAGRTGLRRTEPSDCTSTIERVTIERLGYELALDGLRPQEATLSELRGRTGVILAASSLVASFFGGRALDGRELGAVEIAALAALVATIVTCVAILAPKANLVFVLDGYAAYEYFAEHDVDVPEAERTLSFWITDALERNQPVIERLHQWFAIACVTLVLQVVLWATGLAGTLD
jgi:hypothetical protein